jgi:hypothetical protein
MNTTKLVEALESALDGLLAAYPHADKIRDILDPIVTETRLAIASVPPTDWPNSVTESLYDYIENDDAIRGGIESDARECLEEYDGLADPRERRDKAVSDLQDILTDPYAGPSLAEQLTDKLDEIQCATMEGAYRDIDFEALAARYVDRVLTTPQPEAEAAVAETPKAEAPAPPVPMIWACQNCKSSRVSVQKWMEVNTKIVTEDTGGYTWCDNCETEGKFLDLIPRSECLEGDAAPGLKKVEVLVEISGGCCVDVHCKQPFEYEVLDHDNLEGEMDSDDEQEEFAAELISRYSN